MNVSEGFRESWDMITHNKLRTFLTMLGMNIGVAAVISIMAIGLMARVDIMTGVESIGASLVWITPNAGAYASRDERVYLKPDDLAVMRDLIEDAHFSPVLQSRFPLSYRSTTDTGLTVGVHPEYLVLWKYAVLYGRFIEPGDIERREKSVVLGFDAARQFYDDPAEAVGKPLSIGDRVFTVVGVMAERARSFIGDGSDDTSVYIPYPVMETMMDWDRWGGPRVLSLNIQVNGVENIDYVVGILERFLDARYGTIGGEARFIVHKAEENINTFNKVFTVITTAISLIAAISLLVSGIGIMNIMLVTVTERTKEIGIRKAIGAKRLDILTQFLIEAVIICLIGGGLGIIIGLGIASVAAALQNWRYIMPLYAIALGIGVSVAIGLFFGIFPAMKASRLDPVIALTKE